MPLKRWESLLLFLAMIQLCLILSLKKSSDCQERATTGGTGCILIRWLLNCHPSAGWHAHATVLLFPHKLQLCMAGAVSIKRHAGCCASSPHRPLHYQVRFSRHGPLPGHSLCSQRPAVSWRQLLPILRIEITPDSRWSLGSLKGLKGASCHITWGTRKPVAFLNSQCEYSPNFMGTPPAKQGKSHVAERRCW